MDGWTGSAANYKDVLKEESSLDRSDICQADRPMINNALKEQASFALICTVYNFCATAKEDITSIPPVYHQYITSISPVYHQYYVYHPHITSMSPVCHQYVTSTSTVHMWHTHEPGIG